MPAGIYIHQERLETGGGDGGGGSSVSGHFILQSSFNSDSPAVISMDKQVAAGRSTPFYELAQGQVDYGKKHQPAPCIVMTYEDGRSLTYQGGKIADKKRVRSIEFRNSGPGLRPEDTVIIRHGGNNDTLGNHGQGTSITLTWLAMIGAQVEIHSNHEGRGWLAKTSLAPTLTGAAKQLVVNGEMQERASNETRFVISGEMERLLPMLEKLSDDFLYANPNFRESVVIAPHPMTLPPPLEVRIKNGRVLCLDGIVDWKKPKEELYIDGLKVGHRDFRGKFLFPWAIEGLQHEDYPFMVRRSSDSSKSDGSPAEVMAIALRQCGNKDLWKKLIKASLAAQYEHELPIELRATPVDKSTFLTAPASQSLAEAWRESQGDALIANEEWVVDKLKDSGKKIILVRGELYKMLIQAGIEDAKAAADLERKTERLERTVAVAYAHAPDRLQKLFEEIGICRGEVQVIETNGVKSLQVVFPCSFFDANDLFDHRKPGVGWARAAAIVAHTSGLGISIRSFERTRQSSSSFTVRDLARKSHFDTSVQIDISAHDGNPPEPITIVTLSGHALQEITPPDNLVDRLSNAAHLSLQKALAEEARSAAKLGMPLIAPARELMNRRDILGLLGMGTATFTIGFALDSLGLFERIDSKSHRGGAQLAVFNVDYRDAPRSITQILGKPSYESRVPNRTVEGYYRTVTSSTMDIPLSTRRAEWLFPENFQKIRGLEGAPRVHSTIVRLAVNGSERIPTREGETIVGIESHNNKPVEIWKEAHTGDYLIRGTSEVVTIYFATDHSLNRIAPKMEEKEALVRIESLSPKWQGILHAINNDQTLRARDKAAIILNQWGPNFIYDYNETLDEQVLGFSRSNIAAKIVNTHQGICNTCATGLIVLLRAAKIPSRYVGGNYIDQAGKITPHAWVEFWDGSMWIPVEPQQDNFEVRISNPADELMSNPQVLARYSPGLISTLLIKGHQSAIIKHRHPTPPAHVIPPFDEDKRTEDLKLLTGLASITGFLAIVRRWMERKKHGQDVTPAS